MSIVNKEIISSKKQVDEFIHAQENLSLLRFSTCGSVDDGKSTLIGRILFESQIKAFLIFLPLLVLIGIFWRFGSFELSLPVRVFATP